MCFFLLKYCSGHGRVNGSGHAFPEQQLESMGLAMPPTKHQEKHDKNMTKIITYFLKNIIISNKTQDAMRNA